MKEAAGMRFGFYSRLGITFICGQHRARRTIKDPTTQNKDNMNWYYAQGGQRQGPITESELETLIAAGTITATTLIWKEGMADWLPLNEVRAGGSSENPPPNWIRCTATGRYFPPEEIVYLNGKPYSAAAKAAVLQGVMQEGMLPTAAGERTGPPWEHRAELGFFPAAWQTVKNVLIAPGPTFENMNREGGLGTPLLFNVIFATLGSLAAFVYQFLFNTGMQSFLPPEAQNPAHQAGFGLGVTIAVAIFMPFLIVIGSFVGSGILHLSLMICSGAKQPFETTFRTYCYVQGSSNLLQIIPLCGGLASIIWGIVSTCIGIARTHEIGTGRAVLAVLLPSVVCCTAVVVVVVSIFGALAASQGIQPP
jgi:hypothetical protein